jgi:mitogen-activated protein kinase 15
MTDYVATRWYRPPEVLLGSHFYDEKVDIWALGCTIAELTLGRPLFAGTSTLNQLSKIIQVIGLPTDLELDKIGAPFSLTMFQHLFME